MHAGDMGKGKQVSKVWLFLHGSSTGETSIPRGLSHGQRRKEACGPGRKPRGAGLVGGPREKREEKPAGGPCGKTGKEPAGWRAGCCIARATGAKGKEEAGRCVGKLQAYSHWAK